MKSDFENFDTLRQMLALKRHEQPPPGYFNGFSRDVIARIKAGESGGEGAFGSSWFSRLAGMFDVKPVFAGAFGTAVCGLLVVGVISSERLVANNSTAPEASGRDFVAASGPPAVAVDTAFETSGTNAGGTQSLFDRFQVSSKPVSERYWVPGGVSAGN